MVSDIIYREHLGSLREPFEAALTELVDTNAYQRLHDADHTLWAPDPTEISDRLGWLHSAEEMRDAAGRLDDLRRQARADGFTNVLVMGMGGSSLFPEVLARSARNASAHDDGLHLSVLDSTDPEAVGRALATS